MDRFMIFLVGAIFVGGGGMLAKTAFDQDLKNVFEAIMFGLMGVGFGLFLCYVAIFGPPG